MNHISDPKLRQKLQRTKVRDQRTEHIFRRILHVSERVIAVLALLALFTSLALEAYRMVTQEGYFEDAYNVLHNLLTIVVGLEFVRMLIDTTPANILEVLTIAITRYLILSHENPWSNLACVACIAGLFAIRRFLIPKEEFREEIIESG